MTTTVLFDVTSVDCEKGTATGVAVCAIPAAALPSGEQHITDAIGCFIVGNEVLSGGRFWCHVTTTDNGPAYEIIAMSYPVAAC